MKALKLFPLILLSVIGGALFQSMWSESHAGPARSHSSFERLEVGDLTVKSKDGNNTLSIVGGDNYVGLWLTQKGKKTYSYMFSQTGLFKPYFAIGHGDKGGDPLAFFLDEETGTPLVQLKTSNTTSHYRLADIVAAIKQVELHKKPVRTVQPPE